MFLSILLPINNSSEYLRNCLESILNQSVKSFEIIAIDDYSRDDSGEILEEYVKKDKRIKRYSTTKDIGIVETRKQCIKHAKGKYSIFLNSNDELLPNAIANLVRVIKQFGYLDIIRYKVKYSSAVTYDHMFQVNLFDKMNKPAEGTIAFMEWSKYNTKYGEFCFWWLYAIKTELLKKVYFPRSIKNFDDFALLPLIITKAERVIAIDDECYLMNFYNHPFIQTIDDHRRENYKSFYTNYYKEKIVPVMKATNFSHSCFYKFEKFDVCQKMLLSGSIELLGLYRKFCLIYLIDRSYYLLHPDEKGKRFELTPENINSSKWASYSII